MTEPTQDRSQLEREALVFSRYLVGQEPAAAVVRAYAAYHERVDIRGGEPPARIDTLLLAVARWGRPFARAADVYAGRFRRGGTLRRKLILLIALSETTAPSFRALDRPDGGGRFAFWARFGLRSLREALLLVVGGVLLLPAHLVLALAPEPRAEGRR